MSVSALIAHVGSSKEAFNEFEEKQKAVIAYFVEKGMTRGLRLKWSEIQIAVTSYHNKEVEVRQNPDRVLLYDDYVAEYKDPQTNGLHHKCIEFKGKSCVLIPGKQEWALTRLESQGVRKDTIEASSDLAFTDTMLEDTFEDMALTMFESLPQATGKTLPQVLNGVVISTRIPLPIDNGEKKGNGSSGSNGAIPLADVDVDDDLVHFLTY